MQMKSRQMHQNKFPAVQYLFLNMHIDHPIKHALFKHQAPYSEWKKLCIWQHYLVILVLFIVSLGNIPLEKESEADKGGPVFLSRAIYHAVLLSKWHEIWEKWIGTLASDTSSADGPQKHSI